MWRNGWLPVLAGTAAGLVAAAALTLSESSTYRADASVALVRQGRPPGNDPALAQAAEAAAALFHSRAVAEPAVANLRLDESASEFLERFSVEQQAESSLVRIEVDAQSRQDARRAAQEVAEVATVLFNDRYGPQTVASIWEAARARDDRVAPTPARNLALGGLLGALAGWAIVIVGRRSTRRAAPRAELPWSRPPHPRTEPVAVAVPRPPEPVPEPVLQPSPAPEPVPDLEPEPDVEPEPDPESDPVPDPEPDLAPDPVREAPDDPRAFDPPAAGGGWTVAAVERLIGEQGDAFPERAEEFSVYASSIRDVAEPDGSLPPGVVLLVEDVFADLIERARE